MKTKPYEIKKMDQQGILAEMGVEVGDRLLSINDIPITDELDIYFCEQEDELLVKVEKPDGEIWELEIEKEEDEELGLVCFDGAFGIRRCQNQCVFCFIDQMPPGMRETLYIKDDDERLSFLQGNYITLTNLSEALLHRIVQYHITPINISIHTTDPELRCRMLNNRKAGKIMDELKYLADNGIAMNGQIVLCPGYNDGAALEKTLEDLAGFYPALGSLSVVPVGLSDWRKDLPYIAPVDGEKARETLAIIEAVQDRMMAQWQTHFVYGSDELYLLSGTPIPSADFYEDFVQLENGVGMLAEFKDALVSALKEREIEKGSEVNGHFSIITGFLAADFMRECADLITKDYPDITFEIIPIENHCFGKRITVSGLVTGKDIIAQMPADLRADAVFVPENMIRYQTDVFLDDVTTEDVAKALMTKVVVAPVDGALFLDEILELTEGE